MQLETSNPLNENWGGGNLTLFQYTLIHYTFISSATLSLLGSTGIIISYCFFTKTLLSKLIFCLAISDMGYSMSCLLSWAFPPQLPASLDPTLDVLCQIQGIGIQFFQLSSYMWTSCLAWHAFSAWVRQLSPNELAALFKWYCLISWGIPSIPAAVSFALHQFGISGGWCWVKSEQPLLGFLIFYLPSIFIWVFNIACYGFVIHQVSTTLSFMEHAALMRIGAYIAAFLITSGVPMIDRFLHIFNIHLFPLLVLHAFFDPLLGICDCLVYGLNRANRAELKKCCLTCKGTQEYDMVVNEQYKLGGSNTDTSETDCSLAYY